MTSRGALVAWTDDHELGRDHVYGVMLDGAGRALGPARDLTPEAVKAARPQLLAAGADRFVLVYADEKGAANDVGVHVRFLDGEGRIGGHTSRIGGVRKGDYAPTIAKAPDGFFVAWPDDRDKEGEHDVFVRKLSKDRLETMSPETRLTDYYAPPKAKLGTPRVRYPSIALAPNALLVAYKLEHDKDRSIERLRVSLSTVDKGGLDEWKDSSRQVRESRVLGDVLPVVADKTAPDAPAIVCGSESCFVAWHSDPFGAHVAQIEPKEGKVVWFKRFSEKGGRPSLGVNEAGQVVVTYFELEKGERRLKMAFLSRDGVVSVSSLLRAPADLKWPRPSIAPGVEPNEWYVSWTDAENGRPEVYAARVKCGR